MVSDYEAEKAADFLRENADRAGELRSERIYLEEMRKHHKALLMQEVNQESIGAQERYAYSHPKYSGFLKQLRDAVYEDEKNRALREAACMKISVYQTQSANTRGKL